MSRTYFVRVSGIMGTFPSHVERAVRQAIEVVWDRGDWETVQRFFLLYRQQYQGKTRKLCIHRPYAAKFSLQLQLSKVSNF